MPRPPSHRVLSTIHTLTTTPPSPPLPASQNIARILSSAGNNLYRVLLPTGGELLVELPALFRGKVWLKRGGYVLVDTKAFEGRENKLGGAIVNVVRDERVWRKETYWPEQFGKEVDMEGGDESGEESTVGKMPPRSDDEDD